MLVYANHLSFQGDGAKEAIFKAIGGWLKEQLGFGLHPEQLKEDGNFEGIRGKSKSWLRVCVTIEGEPELYSWVLKNADDNVRGRQWITELGLKVFQGTIELSCVVKTDEQSALVAEPVSASRPRLIPYVVNNIEQSDNAEFSRAVPGVAVKTVGEDVDSYRAFLAEIEQADRGYPIVLVSPTRDGEYLVNTSHLQESLIGLAQVVQVTSEFNSYEMEEILGQHWSAWNGSVNILHIPTPSGFVRGRFFLSDAIEAWGDTQHMRISQLLAWVTNNTNIPHLRKRIRSEGVMLLALRRRLDAARAKRDQMDSVQLSEEMDKISCLAEEQGQWIKLLEDENSQSELDKVELKVSLDDVKEELSKKDFALQSLKDQLANVSGNRASNLDAEKLINLACCPSPPSPSDCIEVIESIHGDKCIVLDSARDSARNIYGFICGRQLLDMLVRLVTEYRSSLIGGGDNSARTVFGKNEYAAKESETVMGNKSMRRTRTFFYRGNNVEMFRHLKLGVADDPSKTIRVYFHWDGEREKIVIGYCGKHLPVSSH